jgi:hypothetical protein
MSLFSGGISPWVRRKKPKSKSEWIKKDRLYALKISLIH